MPENKNTDLEQAKLDFEKVKHRDEISLRERELELNLKQSQQSAWRSPMFLAVIAGVVGLLSNALVALLNGSFQRTLEKGRSVATQNLEKQKAEAERILEALKTGDPDKAAANLDLMVRTGLVTSGAEKIQEYLDHRKPGEGASLPAPSGSAGAIRYGGVVGTDDRISIKDVTQPPFYSICKIKFSNSKGWSTGFLVHPRIVVIPSYAINEPDLHSIFVYTATQTTAPKSEGIKPTTLIRRSTGDKQMNYSFLVLPKNTSLSNTAFDLASSSISNDDLMSVPLHFGGFPGDRDGMTYNVGKAVSVTNENIYHLLDTGAGAGGGPLWIKRKNKYIVVAVHLSTGGFDMPGKVAIRINASEIRSIIHRYSD